MTQSVRAVYEHGVLRLLEPAALHEGQQVNIIIEADESVLVEELDRRLREAGVLVAIELPDDFEPPSDEEFEQLTERFTGDTPIDQWVDEERLLGIAQSEGFTTDNPYLHP